MLYSAVENQIFPRASKQFRNERVNRIKAYIKKCSWKTLQTTTTKEISNQKTILSFLFIQPKKKQTTTTKNNNNIAIKAENAISCHTNQRKSTSESSQKTGHNSSQNIMKSLTRSFILKMNCGMCMCLPHLSMV